MLFLSVFSVFLMDAYFKAHDPDLCVDVTVSGARAKMHLRSTSFRVVAASCAWASIFSPQGKLSSFPPTIGFCLVLHIQANFGTPRGPTWGFTVHFLMNSLVVTPLPVLCRFFVRCEWCFFPRIYSALVESIMGSCAYRPITQTSLCGKGSWRSNDFFYLMFSALLCLILRTWILPSWHKLSAVNSSSYGRTSESSVGPTHLLLKWREWDPERALH